MKSISLWGMAVVLFVGNACAQESQEGKAAAEGLRWYNGAEVELAMKQAKKEENEGGKKKENILIDFTGSDWCPPCIRMKKEVLSTKPFAAYAKENLILIKVDSPHRKKLPPEVQKANQKIQSRFEARYLPTFAVLNRDGKELGRMVGYQKGGPKAFIKKLEKIAAKEPEEGAPQLEW